MSTVLKSSLARVTLPDTLTLTVDGDDHSRVVDLAQLRTRASDRAAIRPDTRR
jgi:hypothetical protein